MYFNFFVFQHFSTTYLTTMTPPKNWGHVIFLMTNFMRNSQVSFFLLLGEVVRSYIHPNTCLIFAGHIPSRSQEFHGHLFMQQCFFHPLNPPAPSPPPAKKIPRPEEQDGDNDIVLLVVIIIVHTEAGCPWNCLCPPVFLFSFL